MNPIRGKTKDIIMLDDHMFFDSKNSFEGGALYEGMSKEDIIYLKENGVDLVENSNPQRFILSAQFAGGFTELTEKEALEFIKDNKNAEKIAELTRNK